MIRVSIAIPTYRRERVLVETIEYLLRLDPPASEILIVDQSATHEPATTEALETFDRQGQIRWLRLPSPSIPHAMNVGLREARSEIVMFLDDDIIPTNSNLVGAHALAHARGDCSFVAGQVLQPKEEPVEPAERFLFRSNRTQFISEFMGGNFSIRRSLALRLGGFDENFVHVAYRFEAEFAGRLVRTGERILFEPSASIRHLKVSSGGTRSFGHHLTTVKPSHAVGEYYFVLRSSGFIRGMGRIVARPLRAVRTRHHLTHPWWIPATLCAEALGFVWAIYLSWRGPKLMSASAEGSGDG